MIKRTELLLLFCLVVAGIAFSQETKGLEKLDFFIGEWELVTENLKPDGSYEAGNATSRVYYILDGHAIQDDFRTIGENGEVIFRGTSIRSFSPEQSMYVITWLMPGTEGITDIRAAWVDGNLIGNGEGYDGNGSFKERFEYYNISDSTYMFRMDRSYDGEETWLRDFAKIRATRKTPIQESN